MIFGNSVQLRKGESPKFGRSTGDSAPFGAPLSLKKESFEIASSLNYEFGNRLIGNRVDP
ncbi:hypothetical protein EHO62_17145 [Leptospira kmetyi]|nr:hypothetical protein EHO62_17145 [Leptospira kmetyi]TGK31183.1 hypothetical protein EHO66_08630 [Leptospira kmetyi]